MAVALAPAAAVAQQPWGAIVQGGGYSAASAVVREEIEKSRDAGGRIAIKVLGTPDDGLVQAVADLFVPTVRKFPASYTLEKIVLENCGYRSAQYEGRVLLENPKQFAENGVLAPTSDTVVALKMPACLVATNYVTYRVQKDESIAMIAGSVSHRPFDPAYCAELAKVNRADVCRLSQSGRLKQGDQILVPRPRDARTSALVGKLNDRAGRDEVDALALWISAAAMRDPVTETRNAQELKIEAVTPDQTPRSILPTESCSKSTRPFDLDKIIDVIGKLRRGVRHGEVSTNPRVRLGIIDSGLYDDVRRPFFERIPVSGSDYMLDENQKPIRNLIPQNAAGVMARAYPSDTDDVRPDDGQYADHGTHIAGLVVGGGDLWNDLRSRTDFKEPEFPFWMGTYIPEIIPVKIMSAIGGAAPKAEPAYFGQALRFLVGRADVVNISAVMRGSNSIDDDLEKYRASSVIFVSAAGNNFKAELGNSLDGEDINRPVLPAMKSGPEQKFFITVGALDSTELLDNSASEGRPAEFSQRGRKYVDLFAPGTCIRSFGRKNPLTEDVAYSGTSQAAPLVSFAAAMLLRFGVPLEHVKDRLMDTVDASDELENISISGGALNLAKALDYMGDIVVLRDKQTTPRGAYLYGTLVHLVNGVPQPPGYLPGLCASGEGEDLRSLRRIIGVDATRIRVVPRQDRAFQYKTCDLGNDIRFRLLGERDQPLREFGLAEIREIIPRPWWLAPRKVRPRQ